MIPGFEISEVSKTESEWQIHARAISKRAVCVGCGQPSERVHSYCRRTLRDLAVDERAVKLCLTVRRFRCQNSDCARKTFSESIAPLAEGRQRFTTRCRAILQAIGLALNGEGGARLASKLRISTSGDTILRIVRQTPELPVQLSRVVGVDDWAKRKRHTYGTIIVDLEAHQVVDVLEDRTAKVVSDWLTAHPTVDVVARDRSTEYASGISRARPVCQQVADRWHLLHNLWEALDRLFQRLQWDCDHLIATAYSGLIPQQVRSKRRWQGDVRNTSASQRRRQSFYDKVQRLRQRGFNIKQIARKLGCSWTRARDYFRAETCPTRRAHPHLPSILDAYTDYLSAKWQAGCQNAQQLWRDIRAQGFTGSHRVVTLWAQARRNPTQPIPALPAPLTSILPSKLPTHRELASMILARQAPTDTFVVRAIENLRAAPIFGAAISIAQNFAAMIRKVQPSISTHGFPKQVKATSLN